MDGGSNDPNPAMSPDGTRIAFSRPATGGRDLFVMNTQAKPLALQSSKAIWEPSGDHTGASFTPDLTTRALDGSEAVATMIGRCQLARRPGGCRPVTSRASSPDRSQ